MPHLTSDIASRFHRDGFVSPVKVKLAFEEE